MYEADLDQLELNWVWLLTVGCHKLLISHILLSSLVSDGSFFPPWHWMFIAMLFYTKFIDDTFLCSIVFSLLLKVHPPFNPLSCTLTHSLTHTLTHSHSHSLTDTPTHTLTLSVTHSLTHTLTHSHTHSHTLTHTHTHSLTHSHISSLTHSLTNTLTHTLDRKSVV